MICYMKYIIKYMEKYILREIKYSINIQIINKKTII